MKISQLFPAAVLCFAANAHAALIHQYDFNGNFEDSLGGIALKNYGGTIGTSTYTFGRGEGLHLVEKLGPSYSIDMVFQFTSSYIYQNIINLQLSGGTSWGPGVYTSHQQFRIDGGPEKGSWKAGEPMRITFTREANGTVALYYNGELAGSGRNRTSYLSDNYLTFFATNNDREGAGFVDYIRIYDEALTAEEVGAIPATPVPEPGSLALLGGGVGLLGLLRRKRSGRIAAIA